MHGRRVGALAGSAVLVAAVATVLVSSDDVRPVSHLGALGSITDRGDGCPQVVSAIGYADALLVDLGQERYQDFDVAVRSRLSQVAGTTRIESADWPDERVGRQARQVAALAFSASRLADGPEAERTRAQALVAYKAAAAQLVLMCQAVEDEEAEH